MFVIWYIMSEHRCVECLTVFKQKKNLYAHIRNSHGQNPALAGSLLCPVENCLVKSNKYDGLRKHLNTSHSIKCEKEVIQLTSWEEFVKWKQDAETSENNAYVLSTGSVTLATKERKSYYSCHRTQRSGTKSKQSHKMTRKSPGTKKICKTCPSTIETSINGFGVTVVRWKTHWGHFEDTSNVELNLRKLSNSPTDSTLGISVVPVSKDLNVLHSLVTAVDSVNHHKDFSNTSNTDSSPKSHINSSLNRSCYRETAISLSGSLADVIEFENSNIDNGMTMIDSSKIAAKANISTSSPCDKDINDKLDLLKNHISKEQLTMTQCNYLNKMLDQCLDICLQASTSSSSPKL